MRKMVKINLNIDRETWERFKELARSEDLSASQMIRGFIRGKVSEVTGAVDPEPSGKAKGRRSRRKEG